MTKMDKEKKILGKNKPHDLHLIIDGNAANFNEFFGKNKGVIYSKILEGFRKLINEKKDVVILLVTYEIMLIKCNTIFTIDRTKSDMLLKYILPHFEETEEYEICKETIDIEKTLSIPVSN